MPVQLTQSENVRGPLIVAGDCNGVGSSKVAAEVVTLVTQLEHVLEGGEEVRDPWYGRDPDGPDVAR